MQSVLRRFQERHFDSGGDPFESPVFRSGLPSSAAIFALASAYTYLNPSEQSSGALKKKSTGGDQSTPIIIVAASNAAAESMAAEAAFYLGQERAAYFPGYEGIPYEYSRASREISIQRVRVLHALNNEQPPLVFTSPEGIRQALPDPARISRGRLQLRVDETLDPSDLKTGLLNLGYERVERVEVPGEFCVKGSIVDIFPAQAMGPVRVDFFDDIIESVRAFDIDSQIGRDKLSEVLVLPAAEIVLTEDESRALTETLMGDAFPSLLDRPDWLAEYHDYFQKGIEPRHRTISQLHHGGLGELFSLAMPAVALPDVFPTPPRIIMFPAGEVRERALRLEREYRTLYERESENRVCLPVESLLVESFPLGEEYDGDRDVLRLEALGIRGETGDGATGNGLTGEGSNGETGDGETADGATGNGLTGEGSNGETEDGATDERGNGATGDGETDDGEADLNRPVLTQVTGFKGRIREVREHVFSLAANGATICITSPYTAQLNRIAGIFRDQAGIKVLILDEDEPPLFELGGVSPRKSKKKTSTKKTAAKKTATPKNAVIRVCRGAVREGWSWPEDDFHVWTDADIFGRGYKRRSRFKKTASAPLESFIDLKEGDHVVHVNHGVGKFVKLERVKAAGRERDFLVLEYADEDRLFVPLDQISMVQRYLSSSDKPRLDSLGKSSFKKIKERVQQRIEELAQNLIEIYAMRMAKKGFSFPPDSAWQDEFEAAFQFDETPDQMTAIEAVKTDMETPRPMDRLICGDVGYGKTEVAIRAVFKAIMAGRQAVLIAPTTILALQHFRVFKERFRDYPINVDWISRFRTQKEVTAVKKALREGDVDLVVGTHALLSEDVRPRNLGLLVVDEEQRFGVTHKEAIKSMKKLVDVLTLSATPIPRTLHMSLVGIRDLSVIQTPPRDRLPVRTYVMEDSDAVLREAVMRELERGGQVFFLHNRIETIEAAAHRIRNLVPRASYTILPGRMMEEQIEDTLLDFVEKKYDVLVTTTIIESGIDMPNVNTLIVDRADHFGLSQLYQIRGRVGRSNRQAYAYMFYSRDRVMNEQAQKRLNTIQEYQELGSGFKVAMRDLEIRGAGNILGKEQSGDIMDVGYELYVKLLESAVKRLQGSADDAEVRCTLGLNVDYLLPEEYIADTRQRIEFYKRFEAALEPAEVERLQGEMTDRFGRMPEIAENFVQVERIRVLAGIAGFQSLMEEPGNRVRLTAGDSFKVPPAHVVGIMKKNTRLSLMPGKTDTLYYQASSTGPALLMELIDQLERIAEPLLKQAEPEKAGSAR